MLVAKLSFVSVESDRRVASRNSPAIVVSDGYVATMDQQQCHRDRKAENGSFDPCSVSCPPADTTLCRARGSSLIPPSCRHTQWHPLGRYPPLPTGSHRRGGVVDQCIPTFSGVDAPELLSGP